MLLCAVVSWGSWPFIRSYCRADTPVFAPMFFTGQLLVAFFVCVTLGDALVPSDPDYGQIQWSTAMLHPGHPGRVIAIIIGGHLNGHADSLLSAVCSVLPFGVAFPIYAGWGLAQGTILNYFLLGMPGNPGFLFGGVAFAILAICCLAYSDSYDKPKPKVLSNEIENPILHEILPTEPPTHYDTKDDSIKIEKPTYKMHAFCFNPSDPRKWIYLCFFAGMMTGSWSPLSTLGEVGDGAITNPYVALFLLECGESLNPHLSYSL
jgi:multidrug transporter EmrE-like cation transporter